MAFVCSETISGHFVMIRDEIWELMRLAANQEVK